MRLPKYQVELEDDQWGFASLYALNVWIKEKNIDPKTIKVYSIYEMAEEEWKQ
jgi:hypothetical protein